MVLSRFSRPLRSLAIGLLALTAACVDTGGALSSAQAAGSQEYEMEYQGIERSYRLYVPSGGGNQSRPLIVALHGGFGTGKNMEELTGFDLVGGNAGFAVAYPDGVGRSWNAGSCCGPALKKSVDDVGFLRAMVADIGRRTPIDTSRVYGTGFSNGAMMVHRVACDAPDLFKAIAAASGGIMVPNCSGKKPIAALLIQGRADPRIPWNGGDFEGNYRPPVRDIFAKLASRNQCAAKEDSQQDGSADCVVRRGCAGNAEVKLCGVEGMGHQWAGGKELLPRLLGKGTRDYNASQKVVQFFQQH
ncbi:polyhydroxybutyrate depolymerase [Solimonas sp. K1W22B-7]|uniref:alpha/beta hydrolase family esterase n=1 Tax=Solimonas sp. K1W22B-7 TaxID=2303331 RepID=UPI000E32E369|nr:PHB depolymerase family esterase [Solimonas sp. K1W22B-7]AXQ28354.1 polyhydroxybutyrate depolymerase [Solimonas sp. K1W22B-7]